MNEKKKQQKLWSGSFIRICLVNLFIFINFHALLPTFPFFVTHLGGDAVAIGVATALFSLASIISRPFVGWLVDTKGRCTVLIIGLVGMALMPMGYFISAGLSMAIILRTTHGIFHAASSNASSTWVTDIIPHSRMGEGLGMYGLSMAISTAIAPALGLEIMNRFGFQPLFAFTTIVVVVSLLISMGIKSRDYTMSATPLRMNELFEKMSVPAAVTQFFFMMAYGVIEVYVAIYAASSYLPSGGIYFVFIALATVGTRLLLGRAIDKYGEARLVYSGNAAIMFGIILLVFWHNIPCYLMSAVLLGYSFGAIQPSLQTMAMHAVSPERRGAASSTFFVAFDLGIALGGFLAGVLVKFINYDMMFLCMLIPCILSWGYYYVSGRNHASSFNPHTRHSTSEHDINITSQSPTPLPFIVTISREYGSGGHHIGEMLAKRLGVTFYDKEIISITAKQSGMSEALIGESEQTVNGLLYYDDPTQTAIFRAQSKVIKDISNRESCVIVGRLANFILRDRTNCLNIFVYADKESRVSRISKKLGISIEEAHELSERINKERGEHCLHYTGYEWGDYHQYHLMINNSFSNENSIVDTIANIIKGMKEENNSFVKK